MSRGFQCKQFFVAHDRCAMKVNTDSLILGSWADPSRASHILDVGTGSGLLALMCMQKAQPDCLLVAVEIDADAALQAQDNFTGSPWAERMSVICTDIQGFQSANRFDCIISNPPYFAAPSNDTNAYQQQSAARKLARSEQGVSVEGLFNSVANCLSSTGRYYCLYPFSMAQRVISAAHSVGLAANRRLDIAANEASEPYVTAWEFSSLEQGLVTEQLVIREHQQYTPAFKSLCKDFYLSF